MDENNTIHVSDSDLDAMDASEYVSVKPASDYTHIFSQPFEWEGKTYETLAFNFSKLKGRDSMAIYSELQSQGIIVLTPRASQHYQLRLAARACGLGADAIEGMPYRDCEVILAKTRNFIPGGVSL